MMTFHFKDKREFYERIANGSLQESMMKYFHRAADMDLPIEADTLLYNFEAEFEEELENGKRCVTDEDVATKQGEIGKLLYDVIMSVFGGKYEMNLKHQKEIETITERKLSLKLSDADIEHLCVKAGIAQLTVSQLLESFIGDLVGGTYSNGSDERDAAQKWYERCGYSYNYPSNFLSYLLCKYSIECVDDVLSLQEDIDDYTADLEKAEKNLMSLEELLSELIESNELNKIAEDYEKVKAIYIESITRELNWSKEQLADYWKDYLSENDTHETFEEALDQLQKWQSETELLRRG